MSESLSDLAAAYAAIGAQIEALNEAREGLRDRMVAAAGGFGTHQAGNLKVSVRHNRRLNAARFAAEFPPNLFPDVYKATPDTAAIKRLLAPIDVEPCYDEGAPTVVVS